MKTLSRLGLMLALAGSLFLSSCAGSYYVTAQPVEPVYERPAAPYQGAVWIDGDWTWSGGSYVYVRGHWDRPRSGRAWVRGNWERGQRGYRWHKGHWR
jgi:WXXGXW repeat (2 copies)